jgi:hypothetical protein
MEQCFRLNQSYTSIVMDVQWKIHARLHSHSCANEDPILLWWNWTIFMYVFIEFPNKPIIFYVAR